MLTNKERLEERIKALKSQETEKYQIEKEEDILRANYLSEIERLKKPLKLNWEALANAIKVSPSYLSQVFRGRKPLNFNTIAKLQKVLNIRFEVKAIMLNDKSGFKFYQPKTPKEIIRSVDKDSSTVLEVAFFENKPQILERQSMSKYG